MKRLFFIPLFFLVACSSTPGRAPVYDVKSHKSIPANNVGTYIADTITDQESYIVQAGDTMYSIAWRAGIDVDVLIKRNNLKKPYIIHTGQQLRLKEKAVNTSAYSQNKKKIGSSGCTSQKCQKINSLKVAKAPAKEYSANEIKKTVKTNNVNKSKVSTKINHWKWPSKGELTKTFANSKQGMRGISISNIRGTPVYAAASGKVVYAGSGLRGYGNLIIIKHNYDYLSAYAHNETLLIKENEQVKVGQKIALMGDSGTDKVYLHFDIRYQGKSVDPLRYLPKQ